MNGRDRIRTTLAFQEPDRPPHFESMFELEHEAFGVRFPDRHSWSGISAEEKKRKIDCCMEIYARIIERFDWDALMVFWPWSDPDGVREGRRQFGDHIMVGAPVGGGLWAIENVEDWTQFSVDLFENRGRLHEEAEHRCQGALASIDRLTDAGADFIFLAHDVAFNGGPFIKPEYFRELVTPYMARLVARVKERGAIAFVHSDGQLMPVLDQILSTTPDVLHSIDPMAGMDIAEVKRMAHGRTTLMGNVQCDLLQHGPKDKIRESVLYCLENAGPGGGYIFSTSNTVYPGMPLEHYEYMLAVFREFCGRG